MAVYILIKNGSIKMDDESRVETITKESRKLANFLLNQTCQYMDKHHSKKEVDVIYMLSLLTSAYVNSLISILNQLPRKQNNKEIIAAVDILRDDVISFFKDHAIFN